MLLPLGYYLNSYLKFFFFLKLFFYTTFYVIEKWKQIIESYVAKIQMYELRDPMS